MPKHTTLGRTTGIDALSIAGELVVVHCAIHPFTRHVTFAVLQELGGQYVDTNGHAEDALLDVEQNAALSRMTVAREALRT